MSSAETAHIRVQTLFYRGILRLLPSLCLLAVALNDTDLVLDGQGFVGSGDFCCYGVRTSRLMGSEEKGFVVNELSRVAGIAPGKVVWVQWSVNHAPV